MEAAAFLKHITDEPDDTVSRLVFADWLREQDDPALTERGEFIHLQHALAEGTASRDDRSKFVARQKELLTRHRPRWDEPFQALADNGEYRRGFVERVTLSAEQLVDNFAELIERTPVVRVRLSGLTVDTVEVVTAVEELARLRELDFNRQPVAPSVLRDLLASPHLARLRYLNLARTGVGDDGVRALVASPVFRRLRYINLSHANVSTSGVHALVGAIYNRLTDLEILVLRGALRVQPSVFPLMPHGWPFRLRQSLRSQLGLELAPPENLLARLYAAREGLSAGLRQLVEWLHAHKPGELSLAVKHLPLPGPLREVFALVCRRRVVWRAKRSVTEPPALPLAADGRTDDLPEVLKILMRMAVESDSGNEPRALTECLLDLYLRHERGDLPLDGKTR